MENTPTFSILHATARVPNGWKAAYETWSKRWAMQYPAEYILAVEEADSELAPRHPELVAGLMRMPFRLVVQGERKRSCVANWNAAAAASRGKILILAEDDAFPSVGWDVELVRSLEEVHGDIDGEYVAWISTGMPRDESLIAHPIMSRALYDRWGYFYWPEYESMGADDDLTYHARQDGVVVDLRHIKHEHMHPLRTGGVQDEVFRHQNRTGAYKLGKEIFARRLASKFATTEAVAA